MNGIWANRLIAYAKTGEGKQWAQVPASRKNAVKAVLKQRVVDGGDAGITAEQYEQITGEVYVA